MDPVNAPGHVEISAGRDIGATTVKLGAEVLLGFTGAGSDLPLFSLVGPRTSLLQEK